MESRKKYYMKNTLESKSETKDQETIDKKTFVFESLQCGERILKAIEHSIRKVQDKFPIEKELPERMSNGETEEQFEVSAPLSDLSYVKFYPENSTQKTFRTKQPCQTLVIELNAKQPVPYFDVVLYYQILDAIQSDFRSEKMEEQ
jgi:hypothetical protein